MRSLALLSREEFNQLEELDGLKQKFVELLHDIGGTIPDENRIASRDLSLSRTAIEDAVLRAKNHILQLTD